MNCSKTAEYGRSI